MRLLDTSSLALEEFIANPPPYAILSHTWQDDEVLYQDFRDGTQEQKKGYEKVKEFCNLALSEGHRYAWVDTCCIDKSSSAELQESINSMYNWYKGATTCYVYLEDVEMDGLYLTDTQLQSVRWMTRGWTLQELIAPSRVLFFAKYWEFCGTRRTLARHLYAVTGIDLAVLSRMENERAELHRFSIAQRMSWCSKRTTTRPEDIAYCLLGIFDVHLPLLYGEGATKAFFRLQEAIMQYSTDYSIMAWQAQFHPSETRCLAKSPSEFKSGGEIICFNEPEGKSLEMTNAGLRVHLPIIDKPKRGRVVAVLHNCRYKNDFKAVLGIELVKSYYAPGVHRRIRGNVVTVQDDEWFEYDEYTAIILERSFTTPYDEEWDNGCFVFDMHFSTATPNFIRSGLSIRVPPIGDWYAKISTLRLDLNRGDNQLQFFCTICYTSNGMKRPLLKLGFLFPKYFSGPPSYGIFRTSAGAKFTRHKPPRAVRFRVDRCEFKLRVILHSEAVIRGEKVWKVGLHFQLLRRRRRLMTARLATSKASRIDEVYFPVPYDTKSSLYTDKNDVAQEAGCPMINT